MSHDSLTRPIEILYVEDDPGDALLTEQMMAQVKILVNLTIVGDGADALKYLKKQGQHTDRPRPDLILLDLNLPGMSGREILAEIKQDPDLKPIPVVVLTTSDADEDILKSYALGASCYVKKPVGLEAFSQVVAQIENFWFTIVKFPPKPLP